MSKRWMLAGVGALGLALVVVGTTEMPSFGARGSDAAPDKGCGPDAKPANLNFTVKDMNGTPVNLASLKGKVILLDFWATWCGPCKVEIPGFVELQQKYKDKGLVVVGVSVDDTVDKLKTFAAQYNMNYPVLVGRDREDVQDAFGPIWGLPTTYIIGRNGQICKKHMGLGSKEQFEKEILGLL